MRFLLRIQSELRLMKFMPEKDMILQVRLMKIISVRRAGMLPVKGKIVQE